MHKSRDYFLFALMFFGVVVFAVTAQAKQDIRFPLNDWAPELLMILDNGSLYLPHDFDTKIAPPPANDSAQTKQEIAALITMTKERTTEQEQQILHENPDLVPVIAQYVDLDIEQYSDVILFLYEVMNEATFFILRDKYKYQRPRPTQLTDQIIPAINIPPHAAYPSGHAGQAWILGLTLSDLFPAYNSIFMAWAAQVGRNREIAGVHYNSDTIAGQDLAQNVFQALRRTAFYRQRIDEIKQDLIIFEPNISDLKLRYGTVPQHLKNRSFP